MKMKKKILSFLLAAAVVLGAVLPASLAYAQNGNAAPLQATDENENGLYVGKTATTNDDGSYTITMEAYTTGEVKAGEVQPSDIILVLDLSTSMDNKFSDQSYQYTPVYNLNTSKTYWAGEGHVEVEWCSNCQAWTDGCRHRGWWQYSGTKYAPKTSAGDTTSGHVQFYERTNVPSMTRLEALKQSMAAFVERVAEQDAGNRIALVYFHQGAGFLTDSTNGTAFLDAKEYKNTLLSAIRNLDENDLESATEHGKGLKKAEDVFEAYTNNGTYSDGSRNKVVVLVTDGEPAPQSTDKWSSRIVKQAIESSYELKNTYGASVYSVSVAPGTDASDPSSFSYMDKYMDDISSNHPYATHTDPDIDNRSNGGNSYYTRSGSGSATEQEKQDIMSHVQAGDRVDGGYYLTASDTSGLDSIFEKIADQTGSAKIPLDATTEIVDTVTPYFSMPDDVGDVTVTTMDAVYTDGELNWTQTTAEIDVPTVEIDDSTNSITVTGFDFSHNFVAENGRLEGDVTQPGDFHGRKVVIEFTVTPKDGFLGGNQVPTNTADSGVYYEGAEVDTFAVPTVDVPIDPVTVTAQDKNVYLMGDLTADQLKAGSTVKVGDVSLNMTADNYGLEAWQNAYVDIAATVPTDKTDLKADTDYELAVTVSPKYNGTAVTKSGSDTADIYVFKPEITWKDSQLNVGETVNYEDQNYVSTVWKHGNTLDTSVTMVGTAPKLDYGYAPQASAVTQETKVNVTVKIDGTNVTDFVMFQHEKCNFDGCTFDPDECEFIVHIKSFDLTITKTGCNEAIDENQTFVFNVTGPNGFSMQVVIEGNGSTTIKGLPAGTYTVKEDTSWSWRYETANPTQTVTAGDIKNGEATVTFVNTRDNKQWLNGSAYCKNDFSKTVL